MKITKFLSKKRKLFLYLLMILTLFSVSCRKDITSLLDISHDSVLSRNSADYEARLEAIKDKYYSNKLSQKFVANVNHKYSWIPDWEHPKSQIVNDTVSYVFYRLVAYIKSDGKLSEVKEMNAASFLMVKNEKDFFKAFYYQPETAGDKTKNPTELSINKFTGNLQLTNLENGKSFLLDYVEGRVSQAYQKKKLLAVNKEAFNRPDIISYWETQCRTVLKRCTWASDGPTNCNSGTVHIIYSENCNWPQGNCGSNYSLIDSSEDTVCEDVWFPDPPEPIDPGGGGVGGTDSPEEIFEKKIDTSELKPCMASIMSSLISQTTGSVSDIIKKFSGEVPGYNWKMKDGTLPAGKNGETSSIYDKSTGTVTTVFDSQKFSDGSDLSIARTILHESVHAYLIAFFKTDQQSFSDTYPDMVKEWGTYQNWNDTHHSEFVKTFVSEIGTALKEYGTNKGYSLSEQFYQDLAWGGLTHSLDASGNPTETSWFKSAVPDASDRKRIMDNIQAEQYNKDSEGNYKAKQGNTSSCK